MAQPNTFSIVLLGRYAGKDRAVSQALARVFGRDDAWALQVVGASPIVILHNMQAEQSEAVLQGLSEVENAGCQMEIQSGVDEGLPKLGWPAPPRIRGRLISEFNGAPIPFAQALPSASGSASQTAAVPSIQVPHTNPGAGGTAVLPGTGPAGTLNITLPCPYTGQKMKLTLTIQISRAESGGGVNMNMTASASGFAPAPIPNPPAPPMIVPAPAAQSRPVSRPNVIPTAYAGINTPVSTPMVRPQAPQQPPPRASSATARQLPPPPQQQQSDLEEIVPLPDVPAVPAPGPRPIQRRSPAPPRQGGAMLQPRAMQSPPEPSSIPLPDVPVIAGPNGNGPAAPGSSPVMIAMPNMPDDLMSSPMDLDAFEAKVSASGIMRAVSEPEVAEESGGNGAEEDGSICSVFMGKNNSAKVHQLVAELHGISVPEATRYCQKPMVALAKEVSYADAQDIRQRFAALNVNVRITKRK